MEFKVMEITPNIAEDMLKKNIRNRKISHGTVEAYSRDMLSGNWDLNPHPISFDKDGYLMDGQHRLLAVIKSGVASKFVICTDAPLTYNIDNGRKRTALNQLTMRGAAVSERLVNSQNLSVARFAMNRNKSKITITTTQLEQFLFDYEDDFNDLQDCTSKNNKLRGVSIAPVYYALFVALVNGVDHEAIKKFYGLLVSGIGDGSDIDNMVIRQRNILMSISIAKSLKGSCGYEEMTRKVQKLISLYVSGTPVKSIYTPSQDIYTL